MPTEKPRFTVVVSEELVNKIDDFRFENRYKSRSAAAVDLIKIGLGAIMEEKSKTSGIGSDVLKAMVDARLREIEDSKHEGSV